MIGKRKRETQVVVRTEQATSSNDAQTQDRYIFRQFFESHFEPLQPSTNLNESAEEGEDDLGTSSDALSVSDWEGLSDEEISAIEIIEHDQKKDPTFPAGAMQHDKAFMSAKPPVSDDPKWIENQKHDQPSTEDSAAEAINLKHDLALQRLLQESYLFDRSSSSTLTHAHRHKAIDLRVQSLGAKSSLFTQAKMPLSHRRGIIAKAKQKEASRRKEAKENGIILEKEVQEKSTKNARRERGIGGPTLGRFKDGTLKLSRRDIIDIQGLQSSRRVARKRRT